MGTIIVAQTTNHTVSPFLEKSRNSILLLLLLGRRLISLMNPKGQAFPRQLPINNWEQSPPTPLNPAFHLAFPSTPTSTYTYSQSPKDVTSSMDGQKESCTRQQRSYVSFLCYAVLPSRSCPLRVVCTHTRVQVRAVSRDDKRLLGGKRVRTNRGTPREWKRM